MQQMNLIGLFEGPLRNLFLEGCILLKQDTTHVFLMSWVSLYLEELGHVCPAELALV